MKGDPLPLKYTSKANASSLIHIPSWCCNEACESLGKGIGVGWPVRARGKTMTYNRWSIKQFICPKI